MLAAATSQLSTATFLVGNFRHLSRIFVASSSCFCSEQSLFLCRLISQPPHLSFGDSSFLAATVVFPVTSGGPLPPADSARVSAQLYSLIQLPKYTRRRLYFFAVSLPGSLFLHAGSLRRLSQSPILTSRRLSTRQAIGGYNCLGIFLAARPCASRLRAVLFKPAVVQRPHLRS